MRCHTYAEAYEDQMFRNWYLQRFYGPMHYSLNPGQMHFAQYCADRSKKAQMVNETAQQRASKLRMEKTKQKEEAATRACGSNEQPTRTDGSRQIAFLKNFKEQSRTANAVSCNRSQPSATSNDAASSCSWSVVDDQ